MEVNTLLEPARFAQAIRGLARDAHRTLRHAPSPPALERLSRRIELLSLALGDRPSGPVGVWLDNLGREVRSAAASSRPPVAVSRRWDRQVARREPCLMSS
jgi:hypothetical protein